MPGKSHEKLAAAGPLTLSDERYPESLPLSSSAIMGTLNSPNQSGCPRSLESNPPTKWVAPSFRFFLRKGGIARTPTIFLRPRSLAIFSSVKSPPSRRPPQPAENIRKIPPPSFADNFDPPAHNQLMSAHPANPSSCCGHSAKNLRRMLPSAGSRPGGMEVCIRYGKRYETLP